MAGNTPANPARQAPRAYQSRAPAAQPQQSSTEGRQGKRSESRAPDYRNSRNGVGLWVEPAQEAGKKTRFVLSVPLGSNRVIATAFETDKVTTSARGRSPDATNAREGIEGLWFETSRSGVHYVRIKSNAFEGTLFLNTPKTEGTADGEVAAEHSGAEKDLVIEALTGSEGMTVDALASATGQSAETVESHLATLIEGGKVAEVKVGTFALKA